MKNAHKRWGLGASLILAAASLAMATSTQASAAPRPNACGSQIKPRPALMVSAGSWLR